MYFIHEEDFNPEQIRRVSQTTYDAVVVGGGTSGLISALTLIERGKTVAIIEAGPCLFFTHLSNTELRFQSDIVRQQRRRQEYNQLLSDGTRFGPNISVLGGRSMFWNGAAPRYQPHDFEGWPISLEDLNPHYNWIEEQFRVNTTAGETTLAARIIKTINRSLDITAVPGPFAYNDTKLHNAMLPSGVASGLAVFMRNTTEQSRLDAFDLFANSLAIDIQLNGNKASGVIVNLNNSHPTLLRAKTIVVACGGIESARLLANSSVPDPHRRIGVGLQEHLFYRSFWDGSHLYSSEQDSAIVFVPGKTQKSEQVEIHAPGGFLFATDNETQWKPENIERYEVMMRSFAATRKSDENRVSFQSANLGGASVTFIHTDFENQLREQMKATIASIGDALGMKLTRDGYANIGGSYHEAGGLDMGNDSKISVTDKHGRVHTMDNIYVVDASTFPRIGATNPHLTIGAISRKQTSKIPL
uniref:Glucose-methanol-choline (GMC) oxidoreductase:NAD binding site n=1 Tax=Rheinheimera sp. BAL341 TaxID=1708203 RepID=A0A486XS92_9GAMM